MARTEVIGILFIFLCTLFLYREVFLQGKIVFPSNFLAQFYSPWVTTKFEGWETGIPHKPIGTDQIRFFYPSRTFTNEMFKNDSIPLWNPYIFSGNPHIADYQSAVFYPLNILYIFLPQIVAWSILVFAQPILATVFSYLYLRLLSLPKIAALLGAFAYGFSGFIIVWSQENAVVVQAALWLPLVLFGIEGFLKTHKGWYFLIAVSALTFSFLAGFFQVTFYIFILTFIYSIFRIYDLKQHKKLISIFSTLGIFIFALSFSGIQLVPSIEGFILSPRSTASIGYLLDLYLLPIAHIVNVFAPDIFGNPGTYNFFGRGFYHETALYIGLAPLLLAVFGSFKNRKNPIVRFFVISTLTTFFLAVDSPFTRWFFHLQLPLISTFLPTRIFVLTTFSLAVVAAFGMSSWLKLNDRDRERKLMDVICVVLFLILSSALIYAVFLFIFGPSFLEPINNLVVRPQINIDKNLAKIMIKNTVLPLLLLIFLTLFIKIRKQHISILGLLILTFLGQFYFLNKYLVLGFPQFLYSTHPVFSFLQQHKASADRFLAFGQPILGNISTQKHLYSPEGLDPIFPYRYGQLLFAAKHNGKLIKDIPRIEATMSELEDKETLSHNKKRLRLMSLLGVKYLAYYNNKQTNYSVEERFPKDIFSQIWRFNNWYGFVYKKTYPRAFLVDKIYIESNPQRILDVIFDQNFDLSKTVILEEKPTNGIVSTDSDTNSAYVKIKKYEAQKVEIIVKTDNRRMLFLSDNYYPGWKASIDSIPTKIYRANFAFRAVVVPKGEHTITFIYSPTSFAVGKLITFVTLTIIIAIVFLMRRKIV